jgi:hypothetical protein
MPIPLPIINNTNRVALKWTGAGGQTAVNVIHISSGGAALNAAGIFAGLAAAVDVGMWDAVSSGAFIGEVDITPLDGVSATSSFLTGGGAVWSGSSGGDFVPAAAVLVKLQTALRGRANRGRVFLPMITEALMVDGFVNGGSVAVMQTAWTDFQADLQAQVVPIAQVVASYDRRHNGVGAHASFITNYVVEGVLGTQRRRQQRLR